MHRDTRGFTLLEVLVALAILGLGIGVIFQGLGQSLRLRRDAAENVRLAIAAEHLVGGLLERAEAPAAPEEGEEGGYRWRLVPTGPSPGAGEGPGGRLVEIRLIVESPSGRGWEMTTLLPGKSSARP